MGGTHRPLRQTGTPTPRIGDRGGLRPRGSARPWLVLAAAAAVMIVGAWAGLRAWARSNDRRVESMRAGLVGLRAEQVVARIGQPTYRRDSQAQWHYLWGEGKLKDWPCPSMYRLYEMGPAMFTPVLVLDFDKDGRVYRTYVTD